MEYSTNFNFALPSRDNDVDLADINEISNNFRKIDENATKKQDFENLKNEVEDARVGYDGTVYTSLGEAVRGQCLKLKDETIGAIADVDIEILYYAEKCTLDKYLAPNNGTICDGPGDFASDFMPLKLNTDYAISRSLISYKYLYLYDETKAYIGYVNLTSNTFNITENTLTVGGTSCASVRYFRISGKQNNDAYKRIMVVYGTELPTEYTKYARYEVSVNDKAVEDIANNNILIDALKQKKEFVGTEQVVDDAISCDKTDFLSGTGTILFDKEKAFNGYIDGNGKTVADSSYYTSDFMPFDINTDYAWNRSKILNGTLYFYKSNDETTEGFYLGRTEIASGVNTFNIDATKFSEICGEFVEGHQYYFKITAYASTVEDVMLVYGTQLPNKHTKYAKYDIESDVYFDKMIDSLSNRWNGKTVSILGDSITKGHGVNETKRWATLIKNLMYLKKVNVYGVTSSNVSKRTDATNTFVDRVTTMNADSDLYIVFGGINDFLSSVPTIGEVTSTSEYEFCGALNYIIEQIYTLNANAEIVFMTPIHDCSRSIDSTNTKGYTQKDFRDAIIDVASRHSIPVIDLYSTFGVNNHNKSIYMISDNLHPNAVGHERLAKVIATALRNI